MSLGHKFGLLATVLLGQGNNISVAGSVVEAGAVDLSANPPVGTTAVQFKDGAVNVGGSITSFPWTVNYADLPPGSRSLTAVCTPANTVGPRVLTVTRLAPVLTSPSTSTVSIGSTVSLGATIGAAGHDTPDTHTTAIRWYFGDPNAGGTLIGTDTADTAGAWAASWDTTGVAETNRNIYLQRDWTDGVSQTGTDTYDTGTNIATENSAFTFHFETLIGTSGNWVAPTGLKDLSGVANRVQVEQWGGGGSGLLAVGGGAGGEYSLTPSYSVTPGNSYPWANGAGGTAGGNGGNTTFDTTGCIANGGQSRLNGNAGGTGGTGTTLRAGGAGASGGTNTVGGATGGATSAASGTTPGAPTGAATFAGQAGNDHGSGGGSSAAAGFDGGRGETVLAYQSPAPAGYPRITGGALDRSTANGTTHTFALPGGTGGKVLRMCAMDGAAVTISASGYTALTPADQGSQVSMGFLYIDSSGSETNQITSSASQELGCLSLRVVSSSGGVPGVPVWATTTGSSSAADPPSLDTGSSKKYLFGVVLAMDASAVASITAVPTGFTDFLVLPAVDPLNGVRLVVCWKYAEQQTLDPAAFAHGLEQFCVGTFAIADT